MKYIPVFDGKIVQVTDASDNIVGISLDSGLHVMYVFRISCGSEFPTSEGFDYLCSLPDGARACVCIGVEEENEKPAPGNR